MQKMGYNNCMRDYAMELKNRVAFIRDVVASAGAAGVVFGNSGGKDAALVGALCKLACVNTVGVIMPCGSQRNYGSDKTDALLVATQFGIETREVDLTTMREALLQAAGGLNDAAISNIAPRLRMTTLYAIAQNENLLVAGTSNKSERHMGYFTKWGDGASDFRVIADLTVAEVYEFLRYLDVPEGIISKAPSAGLFEGQTDEAEMGVTYASIDAYLRGDVIEEEDRAIIEKAHRLTMHKRCAPVTYEN